MDPNKHGLELTAIELYTGDDACASDASTPLSSGGNSSGLDSPTLPPPSPPHERKRRSSWKHMLFLVIADIVGTGVLELGGNLSKIGWVAGIATMLVFFLVNTYTGILLVRLRNVFPNVRNFGDVATATFGPRAGDGVRLLVYLTLLMNCGGYLLVIAHTVKELAFHVSDGWCSPVTALFAAGILLPFNQIRTLHHMSYMSAVSFFTIVVAVGGTLIILVQEGRSADTVTHLVQMPEGGFWSFFTAFSGFVFAFAGQSIYVEMMSEMKQPRKFKKSLGVGMPSIAALYSLTSFVQYYYTGTNAKSFLLDHVPSDWRKTTIYSFMLVHMLISYTITQVVLSHALHKRVWPQTAHEHGSTRARLHWGACSTAVLVVAYVIANGVPFFDALTGIIGALLLSPIAMIIPCACWLKAVRAENAKASLASPDVPSRIGLAERCVLYAILALGVVMMVVGTIANVRSTVIKGQTGFGTPFSCNVIST